MTVEKIIRTYQDFEEYFKSLGIEKDNDNHRLCYTAIANALNFDECKDILLEYANLNEYIRAYNKDEYLNNILNDWYLINPFHPLYKFSNRIWKWDEIGYSMIHNPKATVRFKALSLCNLTSLAKQVVRMMCDEALNNDTTIV